MAVIAPLQIGSLELATNLLLAPIAGYTDLSFRLVVRGCGGVGLAFTPLLCPHSVCDRSRRSRDLIATTPQDSPLSMQFYGSDAGEIAEAARWAEARGTAAVDINMGCAVPKVVKRGGGSKLLCDPDKAASLVEQVIRAIPKTPVTVKMRLGWDDSRIVAPALARRLEEVGVAAVIVHGRTAVMKFSGRARLDGIAEVVAAVSSIPVIGNGDVRTPQDAETMMVRTGCRGVMIGRWALAAPWIFRDTWSYLTTGAIPPPPTLDEKCALMRQHFENLVRFRGERMAALEFRKAIAWYAKNLRPHRALVEGMQLITCAADFNRALARFRSEAYNGKTATPQKEGYR